MSGWWSSTTLATSVSRSRPFVSSTETLPSSAGLASLSKTCCTENRCWGVSMKPPVPGVDASRKDSGETTWALPAVATTWFSVTFLSRRRSGSTWTWSSRSRWPQIATLATPGTPMSAGFIVQRASTPCWIGVSLSDDSPIIITRLAEDSGWSIVGGRETLGSAWACVSCSCTSWRPRNRSVSGSNTSTTEDSPGTDSERMTSTPATPLSRSASRGTVMSCSTSSAESPSASV